MNCAQCQDQLVAYIEGLIKDQQQTDIENHLRDCATCQQEEKAVRGLQDRLVARGQQLSEDTLETAVLGRIVREQKSRMNGAQQASAAVKLRSFIMKSSVARIAIAAAIAVACLIGVSMFRGTSSIALADVLTQIEKVAVYMYQTSATWIGEPVENDPFDSDGPATVLVSQELGYAEKTIMGTRDPNSTQESLRETYILPEQHRAVIISHKDKQYVEIDFDEDMVRRQSEQRDARAIVKQVLKCEYEHLGSKRIDGIECEGFRTTDPSYAGGLFGDVRVELWVDVETYLPVCLETDTRMDENRRLHTVSDHFQWNVEVDVQEFEPVIPAGYTAPLQGAIQMPALNEESLVRGLQLLVDMGSPSYPESLTMQAMTSRMKYFQEQVMQFMKADDKEAAKAFMLEHYGIDLDQGKPSQEQLTQATVRIVTAMQGTCMSYATLVQDQKDPAYHGDIVTPQDADQVLVRWKVSDSEYRVIFGNLRAETVSTEVLAELEKVLPR